MKIHIQIVAILNIIAGALSLLLGVVVCMMFAAAGGFVASFGDQQLLKIFLPIAIILGGFCVLLSLPNIIVGWGLYNGRPWARPLTLVLAAFWLFAFPIGTLLGIYSFWALLYEPEQDLQRPDQPFTPNMLQ